MITPQLWGACEMKGPQTGQGWKVEALTRLFVPELARAITEQQTTVNR